MNQQKLMILISWELAKTAPKKKVWKEMSLWFQGTKQITLEDQLNIQISTLTSILVYYRSFSSQTGFLCTRFLVQTL